MMSFLRLLAIITLIDRARGHAYMSWPASRNFDDCDNFEPQSVNQHCDNCNTQSCGVFQGTDYADVVHPPTGTFIAGGLLEVETIVTAHHFGYMELRICSRPDDLTQDCFDEHLLVRDGETAATDPAPVDENHPGRWYIPPPNVDWAPDTFSIPEETTCSRAKAGTRYLWTVRLPSDLECEHCVVQWFWVSANSCNPGGFAEYFDKSTTQSWIASKSNTDTSAWWKSQLGSCAADVVDPRTNNNGAEKFWNCADIKVSKCTGASCTTAAPSSTTTATTTLSSVLVSTTTTSTLSPDPTTTLAPTSTSTTSMTQATTTGTNSRTQCMDAPLPIAWSGGGVHTCATYNEDGDTQNCAHTEIKTACCFCGGGLDTTTTTTSSPCEDSQLPAAWSGGGVHTCATYNEDGNMQNCAHTEIETACCFCGGGTGGLRFSALSSPAEAQQLVISRAGVFTPSLLMVVSVLVGAMSRTPP